MFVFRGNAIKEALQSLNFGLEQNFIPLPGRSRHLSIVK